MDVERTEEPWQRLITALQPPKPKGKRGFTASLEDGHVAAALMMARDARLSALEVCGRFDVPTFRKKVKGVAERIIELDMSDTPMPAACLPAAWSGLPSEQDLADAYHEAGHAVVALALNPNRKIKELTLSWLCMPNGEIEGHLPPPSPGVTDPRTRAWMKAVHERLCICWAGMCAEILIYVGGTLPFLSPTS